MIGGKDVDFIYGAIVIAFGIHPDASEMVGLTGNTKGDFLIHQETLVERDF